MAEPSNFTRHILKLTVLGHSTANCHRSPSLSECQSNGLANTSFGTGNNSYLAFQRKTGHPHDKIPLSVIDDDSERLWVDYGLRKLRVAVSSILLYFDSISS
jgi:hypothetical protein